MLIHNVYFWMKDEVTVEQEALFADELAKLLSIDLIARAERGKPAATEARPVTDHSFHTHIALLFASQADHDAYQDHPDHHRFVERCADLWAEVKVYDTSLASG